MAEVTKFAFSFVTILLGCSGGGGNGVPVGPSPYEPLFASPGDGSVPATLQSVYGLWRQGDGRVDPAEAGGSDVRLKITTDTVTAATRCQWPDGFRVIVGITEAAVVTDTDITTTEAKEDKFDDGTHQCAVSGHPSKNRYSVAGRLLSTDEGRFFKVSD